MKLTTLPTATELTALQAKLCIAQRPVIVLVINELERALERGHSSVVIHGTLPKKEKDLLCEDGYQLYEHLDQHREITTITWDPQTPEPEGELYRSDAQAARLLGLVMDEPAPSRTFYWQQSYELDDCVHWALHDSATDAEGGPSRITCLDFILKHSEPKLCDEPFEKRFWPQLIVELLNKHFAEHAKAEVTPSLKPPAASLSPSGGTTFEALALLAFVLLLMFGLMTVTLDHCARAALALQTWLTGLPTLVFGGWCVALALAWLVSLALTWLISTTVEHERHLNLSKRIKRPKTAPQGEHRFTKFTLTPADQAPLK